MNVFCKAFKCLMRKQEDVPETKKKSSVAERIKKFGHSSAMSEELQAKTTPAVKFNGKRKERSPLYESLQAKGAKRGSYERINNDNWDRASISSESSNSLQNVRTISQEDVYNHPSFERGRTRHRSESIASNKCPHRDGFSSYKDTSLAPPNLKRNSSLVDYTDSSDDESSACSFECNKTKRTEHWSGGSVYAQLTYSGVSPSWLDGSFQSSSSSSIGSAPSIANDFKVKVSPKNCHGYLGSSDSISVRSSSSEPLLPTPTSTRPLICTPQELQRSMPCFTPPVFQTPFIPRGPQLPIRRSNSFSTLQETSRADASPNWRLDQRSPSPVRRYQHQSSILPWYNADKLMTLELGVGVIDTHCHLDFLFRRLSYKETYSKYKEENASTYPMCYEGCIAVFCDPSTFQQKIMWESFLECDGVWAAFGCHPHMAHGYDDIAETYLKESLTHERVIALGEIGLDYSSNNNCDRDIQKKVFKRQLLIGVASQLPLVIHCRDAHEDCIFIMKEIVPFNYRIHRHCFTGTWEEAQLWLNTFPNLYLGVTALVTYPSAKTVHESVRNIPLKRLLLETDTPYFLPRAVQVSGAKWSHPGMVVHVAAQVAAIKKDVTLNEVLHAVRDNTKKVYGI